MHLNPLSCIINNYSIIRIKSHTHTHYSEKSIQMGAYCSGQILLYRNVQGSKIILIVKYKGQGRQLTFYIFLEFPLTTYIYSTAAIQSGTLKGFSEIRRSKHFQITTTRPADVKTIKKKIHETSDTSFTCLMKLSGGKLETRYS